MSEWIKCSEQLPYSGQLVIIAYDSLEKIGVVRYLPGPRWVRDCDDREFYPSHWQPLPEPPKRESSFEAWWGQNFHAQGWHDSTKLARFVWDAAIAASKSPDFVP